MDDNVSQDRRYLSNPDAWVTFMMVPVKTRNRGLNRRVGIVLDETRDQGWRVLLTNMFDFKADAPVETYPTLDALLAVWEVD